MQCQVGRWYSDDSVLRVCGAPRMFLSPPFRPLASMYELESHKVGEFYLRPPTPGLRKMEPIQPPGSKWTTTKYLSGVAASHDKFLAPRRTGTFSSLPSQNRSDREFFNGLSYISANTFITSFNHDFQPEPTPATRSEYYQSRNRIRAWSGKRG